MGTTPEKHIVIGRVGKTHGIKGWLKCYSFTDPIENIFNYTPLYIFFKQQWQPLALEDSKISHDKLWIKIHSYDSPEQAAQFTGCDLGILREQLPEISDETFYWADLEGLTVINTNNIELGVVEYLCEIGTKDILVVKGEKEYWIPFIKDQYIIAVEFDKKRIIVDWDADF